MPSIRVHMLVHAFNDPSCGDLESVRAKCATAFGVGPGDITPFRLAACDGAATESEGRGAAVDDIAVAVHSSMLDMTSLNEVLEENEKLHRDAAADKETVMALRARIAELESSLANARQPGPRRHGPSGHKSGRPLAPPPHERPPNRSGVDASGSLPVTKQTHWRLGKGKGKGGGKRETRAFSDLGSIAPEEARGGSSLPLPAGAAPASKPSTEEPMPLKAIATNLFPLPASLPKAKIAAPAGEKEPEREPMSKSGRGRGASGRSFGGRRYVSRKRSQRHNAMSSSQSSADGDSKLAGMDDEAPRVRPTTPTRAGGASGPAGQRRRPRRGRGAVRLGKSLGGSSTSSGDSDSPRNLRGTSPPLGSPPLLATLRGGGGSNPLASPDLCPLESNGERKGVELNDGGGAGAGLGLGLGPLRASTSSPSLMSLSPIPSEDSPSNLIKRPFVGRIRPRNRGAGAGSNSDGAGGSVSGSGSGSGKEAEAGGDGLVPGSASGMQIRARARSLFRQRLDERLACPDGSPVPRGSSKEDDGSDEEEGGGGLRPRAGPGGRSHIVTGTGAGALASASAAAGDPDAMRHRLRPVADGNDLYRGVLNKLFQEGAGSTVRSQASDGSAEVASPEPSMGRTTGSRASSIGRSPASLASLAELMFSPAARPSASSTMKAAPPAAPNRHKGEEAARADGAPKKRKEGGATKASLMSATGTLVFA